MVFLLTCKRFYVFVVYVFPNLSFSFCLLMMFGGAEVFDVAPCAGLPYFHA